MIIILMVKANIIMIINYDDHNVNHEARDAKSSPVNVTASNIIISGDLKDEGGESIYVIPAIRLHAIVKSDVTSSGDLIPWAALSEGGSEDFMKEMERQDNENIKTEPMENVLVVALSFGEASYVAFWE
ncbi:hypothetical protein CEXT_334631 [Caerostris extrusa]|uniref:Uncharacterized protein n=1 Tax=Caerostris extrusa TaxID=172846 RepID=A0AAV4VWQ9_CAEEX|nr:hypothetical protein CEXT_334631 [Caerostris extrusa]